VGHAGTLAANVSLYKKLPYSTIEDFEPIGFMGDVPQILIVRKDFPAQTAGEFYEYVKAHQDELTAGTAGIGSAAHLGGMLLNSALGTNVELVGYKGAGPAMNDLVGGHIDFMIDVSTTALPQIKAGTVRPLAVLRAERIAALPDVPTTAETRLENMEANIWNLLLAPKGTPQPVMDRLARSLREVTQDPAIKEKLALLGVEGSAQDNLSTSQIEEFVQAETARWRSVIEAAGVSAD
jgi:tripartite-type tricarboxylate transporter receptor subunit TctC